ncbi:MAG: NADAR family protein [Candidatus Odinarchaeota archaeon]
MSSILAPELRFCKADHKKTGFLSNLYRCSVKYKGKTFNCSEAPYQYSKLKEEYQNAANWLVSAPMPALIAMAGHALPWWMIREDWKEVKLTIMKEVNMAKYTQNPSLKAKLLATGNMILVEESSDSYWGNGNRRGKTGGKGCNMLGKVLMEVRQELRNPRW